MVGEALAAWVLSVAVAAGGPAAAESRDEPVVGSLRDLAPESRAVIRARAKHCYRLPDGTILDFTNYHAHQVLLRRSITTQNRPTNTGSRTEAPGLVERTSLEAEAWGVTQRGPATPPGAPPLIEVFRNGERVKAGVTHAFAYCFEDHYLQVQDVQQLVIAERLAGRYARIEFSRRSSHGWNGASRTAATVILGASIDPARVSSGGDYLLVPTPDPEATWELHPAGVFRMSELDLARAAWAGEYLPAEYEWRRVRSPAGRESIEWTRREIPIELADAMRLP